MAAVSLLGTGTFDTASGTKTVTATPAAGDLIVLITAHSGETASVAPTDNNADGLGAYTLVNTAVKATSADTMRVYVRNALVGSATSTVFTHAPGTTTGGGLVVLKIAGMSAAGASAIVQSQIQSNQAAAGTPAPVLGGVPSSTNPIIAAVFNASSPAAMTPRASYTEHFDNGYATPTTGLEVMSRDSGETSATIQWGGTSATAFASIALEVNALVTKALTGVVGTGSVGTLAPTRTVALTGVQATTAVGTPFASLPGYAAGQFGLDWAHVDGPPFLQVGPASGLDVAWLGAPFEASLSAATSDVTVALTGVQATGAAGTASTSRTLALTGAVATGAAGTVAPTVAPALTGVAATGDVGSLTTSRTLAVTGVTATSAAGTLVAQHVLALTGVQATGAVGTVTTSSAVAVALTGVAATGAVGTLAPARSLAVTGVQATGAAGSLAVVHLLALTGVQATGVAGSVSAGNDITVGLTGVAATGAAGSLAAAHSLALTGTAGAGDAGSIATTRALALTGVAAAGATGSVTVGGDRTVGLTGVAATASVGTITASSGAAPAVTVLDTRGDIFVRTIIEAVAISTPIDHQGVVSELSEVFVSALPNPIYLRTVNTNVFIFSPSVDVGVLIAD